MSLAPMSELFGSVVKTADHHSEDSGLINFFLAIRLSDICELVFYSS